MTETESINLMMTEKFLEVICKQHEAFKFQTGTFIDTVFELNSHLPNFDIIRGNIKEVYYLSFKISNLLKEAQTFVEKLTAKYTKDKPQEDKPRMDFGESERELETIRKRAIKQISKNNQNISELKKLMEMDNKAPPKHLRGNDRPIFQKQADKPSKVMDTKKKLPTIEQPVTANLFVPLELKSPYIQSRSKSKSQKIFEDEPERKSFKFFNSKIEPSILDENTYFKQNELTNMRSQNLSYDQMNYFNDMSLRGSPLPINNFDSKPFFADFNELSRSSINSRAPRPKTPINAKKEEPKRMATMITYSRPESRSHKLSKRERGQYKICPMEVKQEAIRLSKIHSIREASEILGIPEKNIKRWLRNGPERKKGAGRKTMDPSMEHKLLNWIADEFKRNGVFPDCKEVKSQAKYFSNNTDFKASKGWCDKFMRRNQKLFEDLADDKRIDFSAFRMMPERNTLYN